MARPLSDEKRHAILRAAEQIVAQEGIEAATSRIAKAAGVAEGTIFKYFATKTLLLNELYRAIKADVAEAILAKVATGEIPIQQFEAVWIAYLRWGLDNPTARRAMIQLGVSDRLTAETRASSMHAFDDIDLLFRDIVGAEFAGSATFASAIMTALAETTIQVIDAHPDQEDDLTSVGFAALLRALDHIGG